MCNYVTLDVLNAMRFQSSPIKASKLQRWCREGVLPARKFGKEWLVDLDRFDELDQNDIDPLTAKALAELK